jgi:hypothetical protein
VADPSPAVQARLLVYVRAQARARTRIQDTVVAQVTALLRRVLAGRWYDEAAVAAAATQLDGVVSQGQAVTRDITLAYLNQALLTLGVAPPRVAPVLPGRLRPVPVGAEWERPAEQYRFARSQGADDARATSVAVGRATHLAVEDLGLAMRETTRAHLANAADVSGYRRVIHPELSKGGTCGLCVAAADRIYHVDDLMPVHTNCECTAMPIVRGVDPARVFNGADTTELYRRVLAQAGSTAADKLKNTRIQVSAHGELGPVLHDAGHRFRDQGDAVADFRPESVATA